MTDPLSERSHLLQALVEHRGPAAELRRQLSCFSWDEEELVELNTGHLSAVLQRFVHGEIPAEEVVAWADAVEVRDDLGRALGQRETINDVLAEMSSPEIFEDLASAAPRLLARLSTAAG